MKNEIARLWLLGLCGGVLGGCAAPGMAWASTKKITVTIETERTADRADLTRASMNALKGMAYGNIESSRVPAEDTETTVITAIDHKGNDVEINIRQKGSGTCSLHVTIGPNGSIGACKRIIVAIDAEE